ncbi:MAG: YegP family protein [Flavobacteriales bacterium]|nr:YegP family protein [Flavobacteriales bacterium]
MGTFELFQDDNNDLCFRLKVNGKVLLTSEGFSSRAEAEEGIELAKRLAPEARSYERSRSDLGHGFTLQTYEGDVVGTGELYPTTTARDKAIEAVKDEAAEAEVVLV